MRVRKPNLLFSFVIGAIFTWCFYEMKICRNLLEKVDSQWRQWPIFAMNITYRRR